MLQHSGCVDTVAAFLVDVTAATTSATSTSSESRQAPATFADVTAGGSARATLAHPSSSVTRSEVSSLILGAVNEFQRRKKNVIISGVRESTWRSNSSLAMDLFTNHLRLSAAPTIVSTTRLGKFQREGISPKVTGLMFATGLGCVYCPPLRPDHFVTLMTLPESSALRPESSLTRILARRNLNLLMTRES